MIIASIGSVFGPIAAIAFLCTAAVAKLSTLWSTTCIDCGHDYGLTALRAPNCPACGQKRMVANPKKALRQYAGWRSSPPSLSRPPRS